MHPVPPLSCRRLLGILLLICSIALANRAWAAPPVVLFDQAHGQRFVIEDKGPLHLAGLAERFRAAGYTVQSGSTPLTEPVLSRIDILVISGPFAPLTSDETVLPLPQPSSRMRLPAGMMADSFDGPFHIGWGLEYSRSHALRWSSMPLDGRGAL